MTLYDPNIDHRQSNRMKGYDYTLPGEYFVTIVTHRRDCLFGQIADGEMKLTPTGQLVTALWQALPLHFPVSMDLWVLMPNHLHGIIIINDNSQAHARKGEAAGMTRLGEFDDTVSGCFAPTIDQNATRIIFSQRHQPRIAGSNYPKFQIHDYPPCECIKRTPGALLWQRNYYDRIVRNEKALDNIRRYILANPVQWPSDDENPLR